MQWKTIEGLKQGEKMARLKILKTTLISQHKANYGRAIMKVERQESITVDWQDMLMIRTSMMAVESEMDMLRITL